MLKSKKEKSKSEIYVDPREFLAYEKKSIEMIKSIRPKDYLDKFIGTDILRAIWKKEDKILFLRTRRKNSEATFELWKQTYDEQVNLWKEAMILFKEGKIHAKLYL